MPTAAVGRVSASRRVEEKDQTAPLRGAWADRQQCGRWCGRLRVD